MTELLTEPWPWYIGGPLIGVVVPLLLYIGNKSFGVSSSFKHICAACLPGNVSFFNYDWKKAGGWNLLFIAGTVIGAFLAGYVFQNPEPVQISGQTVADLQTLGVENFNGLVPGDLFNWENLMTVQGLVLMIVGGFLVGFGTRYAGGCTSGHAITGMANLQPSSLIAVIGFFIGGLLSTYFLLPLII